MIIFFYSTESRSFNVDISNISNATAADTSVEIAITDNETEPTFTTADALVFESTSTLRVPVALSGQQDTNRVLSVTTTNISASSNDYLLENTSIFIPAFSTTDDVIININPDSVYENDETFNLIITDDSLASQQSIVTIKNDDDAPKVSFAAGEKTEAEGNSSIIIEIELDGETELDTSFDIVATNQSTESSDYTLPADLSFTIPAESNSTSFIIAALSDALDEFDERLLLTISNPVNATLGSISSSILTITDTNVAPVLALSDNAVSVTEGDNVSIGYSLNNPSEKPITFTYTTSATNQTAVAGEDFVFTSGQIELAPGETSGAIQVETLDDSVDEDDKSFKVIFSASQNVEVNNGTETLVTIVDNDIAPLVSLNVSDVTEGQAAQVLVSLSSVSDKTISLDLVSSSNDANNTDYTNINTSFTFNPGETSKSISISTIDDALDENDEQVNLVISNFVNTSSNVTNYNFNILDNDDAPSISFKGQDVNENVGSFDISFNLSEVSAKDISFKVQTNTDTASTDDFSSVNTTLNISAGSSSVSQTFTITQDENDEANEVFNVVISSLENVTAANTSASLTIIDDDGAPNIIINNQSVTEGSSISIPVTLSNSSELPISVEYQSDNGTAIAGEDYTAISGTLTFAPGETQASISLTAIEDGLDEDDKDLNIVFTNPINAELSRSSISVTILDNDDAPSVSAGSPIVNEANNALITFILSDPSDRTASFGYTTLDGSAVSSEDYVAKSGTITFAPGETIKTLEITLADDSIDEAKESFSLSLTDAINLNIDSINSQIFIEDNDDAPIINISDVSVSEGVGQATLAIALDAESGKVITVDYRTVAGTAIVNSDFAFARETVTFNPGQTLQNINIQLIDDGIRESEENFSVVIESATNASISTNQNSANVIVEDDDLPPTISISGGTALEDFGLVGVEVALTNASAQTISVDVATSDGLAAAGLDYEAYSATLVFSPGETSKLIEINLLSDTLDEFDEDFSVLLSNPVNTSITSASATVIIEDSDAPPSISFQAPLSVDEGFEAVYAISLSNISAKDIGFDYAITGVSAADVSSLSGSVLIPAGSANAEISINALEDNLIENTEIINLALSNGSNLQLGSSIYKTQLKNTTVAQISVADVSVSEAAGSANVVISLNATPVSEVEVDYRTSTQSSATALEDYTPVSGTVVFGAGETSKQVIVPIIEDALDEDNETISFILSTPVNGVISDGTATIEIIDNDITSIIINSGRFDEGIDPAINVSLTSAGSEVISVDYAFTGQTATAGEDFVAASGTLTFNPGESSKNITLDVIDDDQRENDELIRFSLSNPVNATVPSAQETITILDNDVDQIASINVAPASEGEQLAVTVSLDFAPEIAAEYEYFTRDNTAGQDDYTSVAGTIVFNPGETEKVILIDTLEDEIKEQSESFEFVVRHSVLGDQVQQINLRDNDSLNVSVLDGSADESAGQGQVEIDLSIPSSTETEVNYQIVDKATGELIEDGVVVIDAGETSNFINIPITDDELDEYDEEYEIVITASNADYIDDGSAKFIIFDNDITPTVDIASINVAENAETVAVDIKLSAQSGRSIVVNYQTQDGTAQNESEYFTQSGTFTYNPGDLTKTVIIPIIDNSLDEPNKSFSLVLGALENAEAGTNGVITIEDDDEPPVISTLTNISLSEDAGTEVLEFSLNRVSTQDIVINYSVSPGTASTADYNFASGNLTIPAGNLSAELSFTIINDLLDELDEAFSVQYDSVTNATINVSTTTIEITDDDFAPSLSVAESIGITEGQSGVIDVALTAPSSQNVEVSYEIRAGPSNSAIDGVDYISVAGNLTFTPGETQKSVNLSTINDALNEANEVIQFVLTNPVNAELQNNTTTVNILDDDPLPVIGVNNISVGESSNSATISVSLDAPSGRDVSVAFASVDGSATKEVDYLEVSGTLNFAAGETQKTITVFPIDDSINEVDETFTIEFTNPVNAVTSTQAASVTILDNDPLPSIQTISDQVVNEADGVVVIDLRLDSISASDAVISYQTQNVSAQAGEDYIAASANITIPANSSGVSLTIDLIDDRVIEQTESFVISFTSVSGIKAFNDEISVTINDNDTGPYIAGSTSLSVDENNSLIGTVETIDPDGDALSYSISGTDANLISVDSATGELSFNEPANFEVKNSYSLVYEVTDGVNDTSANVSIQVNDVNEAPVFALETQDITWDENNPVAFGAPASDEDANTTLSFSLSGTDAAEFSIDNNGQVTLAESSTIADYEDGDDKSVYTFTIVVSDGELTDEQEVTVTITDLNDEAPVFTSDASFTLNEGVTDVITVTTTDADANATVAYSLSGTDAQSFAIDNSGALTFVTAPDFESGKTSYEVTVTADDGANTTDQTIAITITDLNDEAPVFTSDASFTLAEGVTEVTSLTTTDADAESEVTYSITGGADADSFELTEAGVLTLTVTSDFESGKTSYEVTVTANDGVNVTNQTIVVSITDSNDNAPVFTSDASFTIPEGIADIVDITTTDADANSNVDYLITGGPDAASFVLVDIPDYSSFNPSSSRFYSDSMRLELIASADFETKTSYQVIVTANDGVNTANQTITVNVTDLNDEAPVFTSDSTFTIDENTTAVTTLVTTDADANSNVTYSITDGADAANFALTSDGVLTISGADYELSETYEVIVTANDGVNTTDQTISVTLEDVNDNAPVFTSSATVTIDENTTAVTTLVTTDADTNPTVTYSITGGADADDFEVSTTGVLALKYEADFELNPDYAVEVTANDGVNSTSQTIIVNVTNEKEPAFIDILFVPGGEISIPEDDNNTLRYIASVEVFDDDFYAPVSVRNERLKIEGDDRDKFAFDPNGSLYLLENDYETQNIFNLTLRYTSPFFDKVVTRDLKVLLTDVNDSAPVFTNNTSFPLSENETFVTELVTTDADTNPTVTYSITGGADASSFAVTEAGVLTINGTDYESGKTDYEVIVTANDGVNATDATFRLTIEDVNDNAPVFTSDSTFTIDENTTTVTILVTTDADTNPTVTYSITGGADASSFALTNDRVLRISGTDYESGKTSYEVIVTATDNDGTNSTPQTITVTIDDVNDNAPVFTSDSTFTIDENTTTVTTLVTTDADTNPTVTYSITGGADASSFALTNDGVLTISGTDYESGKTSYEVIVTATDNDGTNSTPQTITVTIKDVNDNAPVFTNNTSFPLSENETFVTELVTTDADTNPTVTYSITGGADASSFAVTEAGVLTINGTDYESGKTDYEVIVTANDGVNATDATFRLTIEDVNDNAPVFTSDSTFTIDENTTTVTTLVTTDADTNPTVTYSITGGADASSFAVTTDGVLTISGTDYESGKTSYAIIDNS